MTNVAPWEGVKETSFLREWGRREGRAHIRQHSRGPVGGREICSLPRVGGQVGKSVRNLRSQLKAKPWCWGELCWLLAGWSACPKLAERSS